MSFVVPGTPSTGQSGEIADLTHVYTDLTLVLQKANNLSDVANAATARANLGLNSITGGTP